MKKYSTALGVQGKCCPLLSSLPLRSRPHTRAQIGFIVFCSCLEKDSLTFSLMLSMRPIHRPVHELAILPETWDKMKPDEQEAARAQGKIRFPVSETRRSTPSNI